MNKWPHTLKTYTAEEVKVSTNNIHWQMVRVGMKGMPTHEKLDILDAYRYNKIKMYGRLSRPNEVRIDNYINALKRGGLLNMALEVIR